MEGDGANDGSNNINEINVMELEEGPDENQLDPENEETEVFDMRIPTSHSYMGGDMRQLRGRWSLEPGWVGRLPMLPHQSAVFPGESVPLLLPRAPRIAPLLTLLCRDGLFVLLCPDASGERLSAFGVICEVTEVGEGSPDQLALKARAAYRCQLTAYRRPPPGFLRNSLQLEEVMVLPEYSSGPMLRCARLPSLDRYRPNETYHSLPSGLRRLEEAGAGWPGFVHDITDFNRIRLQFCHFFSQLGLENMPTNPTTLSFWVASNLAMSAKDRYALLSTDCAMHRLCIELRLMRQKTMLCCCSCGSEVAHRDEIFPMSVEGVHSNYTNLGGYMHDVLTVSEARGAVLQGRPSAEYSWFPGYTWTVALCAHCAAHLGWRFDAIKRNQWPPNFYGLCRTNVQPRDQHDQDH